MRRTLPIILTIAVLTGVVVAQPPRPRAEGHFKERLRERIETIRMWKLIETLDMTEEQSMRFFPLLNGYESARKCHEEEQHRLMDKLEKSLLEGNPDDGISSVLDSMVALRQRIFDEETSYHEKVKGILTIEQQSKLLLFNRAFAEEIRTLIEAGGKRTREGGGYRPKEFE